MGFKLFHYYSFSHLFSNRQGLFFIFMVESVQKQHGEFMYGTVG